MERRSRRLLVAGAVALALVAGSASAVAESGSGPSSSPATAVCDPLPPKPPLGDPLAAAADYLGLTGDQLAQQLKDGKSLAEVATAQGKSVDGLKEALLDAAKADLDRSAAAGETTREQEQQILGQLRTELDDFVSGKGGLSIRVGGPPAAVADGGPFETAAGYLGLSVDQLTHELRAGKSLAEIATEHGKSVDGLKQALVAAATAEIEKAVDTLVNQKGLPCPGNLFRGEEGFALPALRVARTR